MDMQIEMDIWETTVKDAQIRIITVHTIGDFSQN